MTSRIAQRNKSELRFQRLGQLAILFAIGSLGVLLAAILYRGTGAFVATELELEVAFERSEIEPLVGLSGEALDDAVG